jgi:hypothetical protein
MACSKTMVMGRISQTLYHVTISIGLPRVSYRVPFFCFLGEIAHPGDHYKRKALVTGVKAFIL